MKGLHCSAYWVRKVEDYQCKKSYRLLHLTLLLGVLSALGDLLRVNIGVMYLNMAAVQLGNDWSRRKPLSDKSLYNEDLRESGPWRLANGSRKK